MHNSKLKYAVRTALLGLCLSLGPAAAAAPAAVDLRTAQVQCAAADLKSQISRQAAALMSKTALLSK